MEKMADPLEPEFARPKFVNAVRTANRRRQADRAEEPKDMNFEIDLDLLERSTSLEFYRGDVIVGDYRHLICIRPPAATSSFSKDVVHRWNFQGCFQTFCAALIHSLLCKIRGRHETASWCIHPHAQKKEEGLQAGVCQDFGAAAIAPC